MNYDFKGITTEELTYKLNRVQIAPNQRLDIKPQFARQVRKPNDNKKLIFISLAVKIESNEKEPKPFDLSVNLVGIFELEKEDYNAQEERAFVIEATQLLYPYLRSAVSNLTAQAYVSPLNLPIINGPIFPEDRDVYAFAPGDVN
ncbi:MAG: protein-export chaperone SecB [Clostridia bacterium]|nr:protein-export chaperone SecB [Clostridia bacterium]MDE7256362.1 protein-export chaperone SecB [Clostridia bacterium]